MTSEDSFSAPPARIAELQALLADREAYIQRCCTVIVSKNEENLKLGKLVESLLQEKEHKEEQVEQLRRQLSELEDSYIQLLATKQKAESSRNNGELESEIRIQQLEGLVRQLEMDKMTYFSAAQSGHDSSQDYFTQDSRNQLIQLLAASQQKVRLLEAKLARQTTKKQSVNLCTGGKKGTATGQAAPSSQGNAYFKRFQERQLMSCKAGRAKENAQVCYFRSKKGLFGVDLSNQQNRRSPTPGRGCSGRGLNP